MSIRRPILPYRAPRRGLRLRGTTRQARYRTNRHRGCSAGQDRIYFPTENAAHQFRAPLSPIALHSAVPRFCRYRGSTTPHRPQRLTGNKNDREASAASRQYPVFPGMLSRSLPGVDQSIGFPRRLIDVRCRMARPCDKGAVLRIRDRCDGKAIRRQVRGFATKFPRIPSPLARHGMA